MGRFLAVAVIVALLAACFPVARQIEPADAEAPNLAFEVTNRSLAEIQIGYEFQAGPMSGAGSGSVEGCQRMVIPFGTVSGTFQVLVNGEVIQEADVPATVVRNGYLVVPVEIARDGTVTLGTMRGAGQIAEPPAALIPGCG